MNFPSGDTSRGVRPNPASLAAASSRGMSMVLTISIGEADDGEFRGADLEVIRKLVDFFGDGVEELAIGVTAPPRMRNCLVDVLSTK